MITTNEQEAFSLVMEHQKGGASENDIRFAFQRFMDIAGVAPASEMSTEAPTGTGKPRPDATGKTLIVIVQDL